MMVALPGQKADLNGVKYIGNFVAVIVGMSVFLGSLSWASVRNFPGDVIYGEDNRTELISVIDPMDPFLLKLSRSTVAIFSKSQVRFFENKALLKTVPYGEFENLCEDEPFYKQESGAFCTGVLVAPDTILTAGHCVEDQQACNKLAFVFDFVLSKNETSVRSVDRSEVYSCKSLMKRTFQNSGLDYAIVKLDRKVRNRAPLPMNTESHKIKKGTPLLVLGHPGGLPLKVTDQSFVQKVDDPRFFVTDTDNYEGGSGSPVFNAQTGLIEGLLIRGETDFAFDEQKMCFRSRKCEIGVCEGEDVLRISQILPFL